MASPQKGRRRGRRRPSLDMLLTTHQAEISLLSMSPTAAGPEPEDYAEDKNAGSTALSARPSGKRAPFGIRVLREPAGFPRTGRGAAAAATWMVRGGVRRRRGDKRGRFG